jgi:phosphoribosylglycinamide formyltransferase 2
VLLPPPLHPLTPPQDREGIRRFAAEDLELPTSPFRFASTEEEFTAAVEFIGMPCVVKPVMSSSGKGQSVIKLPTDVGTAWTYAQEGGRAGAGRVIVEGFVDFDFEITMLTVRHAEGVSFCPPVGHVQVDGDYRESWQPQQMTAVALAESQRIAGKTVEGLGGYGLFGVELFVKGDIVYFSEVSPRPHDTGMVTLASQTLSEFALHARAILGLPVPATISLNAAAGASAAILACGTSQSMTFGGLGEALTVPEGTLRLFGKPEVDGKRRVGVGLASGATVEEARERARAVRDAVVISDSEKEGVVENLQVTEAKEAKA